MRAEIRNYFKPFPGKAVWLIVGGIPLIAAYGAGLLLIGIGIWWLAAWSKRPTDAQMDAWLDEDLRMLHPRVLAKTGTDPSELVAEPVMVTGPKLWENAYAHRGFKRGKDNVLRFTPVSVTVINFTAHQLIVYACVLDLTTGNPLNENTDEYFYRDVVSVSTKTKSFSVPMRDGTILQIDAAEMFQLTTSGGTSVEVLLRAPKIIQMMGGNGDIPTTRADKAIQSVRKMLREKKSALVA